MNILNLKMYLLGILLMNATAFASDDSATLLLSQVSHAATAASTAETVVSSADTSVNTAATAVSAAKTYWQQVESYAQQVLSYQDQILKTEMLIRNLEEKPLETVVPNVAELVANHNRIIQLANEIDTNSTSVSANMMSNLQRPASIGLGRGSKFELWSDARVKAVNESLGVVKNFNKGRVDDDTAMKAAIDNLRSPKGELATAKASAEALAQQLTIMNKMEELLRKLVGMAAVENAAKLAAEQDAATAAEKSAAGLKSGKDQMFIPFVAAPDAYHGPGRVGTNSVF